MITHSPGISVGDGLEGAVVVVVSGSSKDETVVISGTSKIEALVTAEGEISVY